MKPDNWKLVRGARQLLTLHRNSGARRGHELADLGLIVDGSVLVRNGIIEAVGPTRRIENMADARKAEEIDATGRVVMPAFIDPHASIVPDPGFRRQTDKAINALPATRLEAQADDLLKVMARHGTATIGSLSGQGVDTSGELKILRALHARDRKPIDIASILYVTAKQQDGGAGDELLNIVARRKLAATVALQCGESGVPWPAAVSLLQTARALGLAVRLEMGPVRDLELVQKATELIALSVSAPGPYRLPEIEELSGSATVAIVLPLLLARSGRSGSARELIDNGAVVALGSGLSSDALSSASMQTVIQLACDHCGITVTEAIVAATVNAAWALGLGSRTGSLEHRKQADLILLNASDYHEIGSLAGTNLTHSLIKRGVVLFKEDFPGWPQAA